MKETPRHFKSRRHAKKTSAKKPVLRYAVFVFAGLLVGLYVYFQNAQGIVRDQLPMPFGYGAAVVLSGSMEDRLSVDDLVIIKAADEYTVNDIVVYQDGSSLVIHRIVAMDGDLVITKGDANTAVDEPIDKSRIKGVLVWDIPKVGAVVHILRQPVSVFVMLAAALLLTELSFRKGKDRDTQELDEIKAQIKQLKQDMHP